MDIGLAAALVLPGLATALGGLPLLAFRAPSDRLLDVLLGFTAGVMLGAATFGLLLPALRESHPAVAVVGVVLGGVLLAVLDRVVPHAHARFVERGARPARAGTRLKSELLVTAMVIHNIPEGLAVGAAFAGGGWSAGLPVAVAVGVQNIPEGFAAAAPLAIEGRGPRPVLAVAFGTGIVEPPAALLAYRVVAPDGAGLALWLAAAAGAMLYVVADELVPELRSHGNQRPAWLGALVGVALTVALKQLLG